jgi:EAL domain-containing protein (putative c-di-GMP-specific phosphodiesterase class I)
MRDEYDETVLILDRDREAATSVASGMTADRRLVLTGCDTALAPLVLSRVPVASLIADAQMDGPFSSAVLDLVAETRQQQADCRIVLHADETTGPWCDEARRRGATDIVRRSPSALLPQPSALPSIHLPNIDELIASEHLLPAFQPIVDLSEHGRIGHGFESLARFDAASLPFCDPQFLFEYARRTGRIADLELACLRRTLREAAALPRGAKLFINIHPHALREGTRLTRTLVADAHEHGVPLTNVVLEITEQEKLDATPGITQTIDELRAHGVQFALDDVGTAYSHLDRIECVRPSYLKISHEFGTDFEKNPTRRKIIRNILSLAQDFECEVVLEGIESESTSGAAEEMGARYAQGFYYARPERWFERAEA